MLAESAVWHFSGHVSQEEVSALIEREIPLGSSSAVKENDSTPLSA
jgi:hypothetical protein